MKKVKTHEVDFKCLCGESKKIKFKKVTLFAPRVINTTCGKCLSEYQVTYSKANGRNMLKPLTILKKVTEALVTVLKANQENSQTTVEVKP